MLERNVDDLNAINANIQAMMVVEFEQLKKIKLTVKAKGGDNNGKMFGSVTNDNIASALQEQGYNVDKKKIELKENIRDFGDFEVTVRVYPEITATLKITVVRA